MNQKQNCCNKCATGSFDVCTNSSCECHTVHSEFKSSTPTQDDKPKGEIKTRFSDMEKSGQRTEWICPHGIGHHKGVHGCDGCCRNEPEMSKTSQEELDDIEDFVGLIADDKPPYNKIDHTHCWKSDEPPCGIKGKHRCCLCEEPVPTSAQDGDKIHYGNLNDGHADCGGDCEFKRDGDTGLGELARFLRPFKGRAYTQDTVDEILKRVVSIESRAIEKALSQAIVKVIATAAISKPKDSSEEFRRGYLECCEDLACELEGIMS